MIPIKKFFHFSWFRKKQENKKPKITHKAKVENALKKFRSSIENSGYISISTKRLFNSFGYKKRGNRNIKVVRHILAKNNLYPDKKINNDLKWKTRIHIYNFPVTRLGDLFKNEKKLEDYIFKRKKYESLGLHNAKRQFSPSKTNDKFDILCDDNEGYKVVLELKKKDGGKHSVEQVLRYMGHLKNLNKYKKIRGILVTGERDISTAKAIYGMTNETRKNFKWYLYNYNKRKNNLTFTEVTYSFIKKHLQNSDN